MTVKICHSADCDIYITNTNDRNILFFKHDHYKYISNKHIDNIYF